MSQEPGPNQADINARQGRVNDRQGDLNDELIAEQGRHMAEIDQAATNVDQAATNAAAGERADISEASAAAAEAAAGERADLSEASAAADTVQRDAQHLAQADINEGQVVINDQAVAALELVAKATNDVVVAVQSRAAHNRTYLALVAFVLAVVVILGGLGFAQGRNARNDIKAQAKLFCTIQGRRDANIRTELTFLVSSAVKGSTDPAAKAFLANYPAHLDKQLPPIDC